MRPCLLDRAMTAWTVSAFWSLTTVAAIGACGVDLRNQTPPEFPYQASHVPSQSNVLYPGSTPAELTQLMRNPAHRFLLEVRENNVRNVQAFVTVEGTERPMTPPAGGTNGLWTYEQVPTCSTQYTYHFRVSYRVTINNQSQELGSASSPLRVSVRGGGDVIWFEPGGSVRVSASPGNAAISFVEGFPTSKTIVIQNLRTSRTMVYGIQLTSVTPANSFQLQGVPAAAAGPPPPPAQALWLNCGQTLRFSIQWNGQLGASAMLSIHAAEPGTPFQMNQFAVLTGDPGPG